MKNHKYVFLLTFGILVVLGISSCEIDEPFPEPNASFEIWGVNPENNYYEKLEEPYTLILQQTYDFIVDGEGQQFVFWFGLPGDSTKSTPSGSDFSDRGENHYSKGVATVNGRTRYTYRTAGEFTITFVASSYSYTRDEYKEMIVRKDVEVVAAK